MKKIFLLCVNAAITISLGAGVGSSKTRTAATDDFEVIEKTEATVINNIQFNLLICFDDRLCTIYGETIPQATSLDDFRKKAKEVMNRYRARNPDLYDEIDNVITNGTVWLDYCTLNKKQIDENAFLHLQEGTTLYFKGQER